MHFKFARINKTVEICMELFFHTINHVLLAVHMGIVKF